MQVDTSAQAVMMWQSQA